jgi:hypothetical protein
MKSLLHFHGLVWSEPRFLAPIPPRSGPDSPHYATRSAQGMRWIARGFWERDGELLALASLDEAAGFFGKNLELRAFRFDRQADEWRDAGLIYKNAINNFPPLKLPKGDSLYIAFAGGKQTVEVLRIKLADIDATPMPDRPLIAAPEP